MVAKGVMRLSSLQLYFGILNPVTVSFLLCCERFHKLLCSGCVGGGRDFVYRMMVIVSVKMLVVVQWCCCMVFKPVFDNN
ncbi:hypothetical protein M8C21_008192 [Ambrosia artemisiifolia]|uniref:Uncharacterized protein n=1 Tax=Ambrosia artemisiifolia TaxID=4212 RepID=A0AAD5GZ79_AMBAR|nr:hypothetical protein M8C21_008192 [Ambrosia artemisiifolia]